MTNKTQIMIQGIENGCLVSTAGPIVGKNPDGSPKQEPAKVQYCADHADLCNYLKRFYEPISTK